MSGDRVVWKGVRRDGGGGSLWGQVFSQNHPRSLGLREGSVLSPQFHSTPYWHGGGVKLEPPANFESTESRDHIHSPFPGEMPEPGFVWGERARN